MLLAGYLDVMNKTDLANATKPELQEQLKKVSAGLCLYRSEPKEKLGQIDASVISIYSFRSVQEGLC